MQTYIRISREDETREYKPNKLNIIEELQSAPSRISDIERICYEADGCACPSCPSCVCDKAKFLYPLAPGGMAATVTLLVIAKAGAVATAPA